MWGKLAQEVGKSIAISEAWDHTKELGKQVAEPVNEFLNDWADREVERIQELQEKHPDNWETHLVD